MREFVKKVLFAIPGLKPVLKGIGEKRLFDDEKRRFYAEAQKICNELNINDADTVLQEYAVALDKYRFQFHEWYLDYQLRNAPESVINEFIARSEAQYYYRQVIDKKERARLHNKELFLKDHPDLIHRKWLAVTDQTTPGELKDILSSCEAVIVKPTSGSLGQGVRKTISPDLKNHEGETNLSELLKQLKAEKALVEECIVGSDELQRLNPSSLNTIRIVTCKPGETPEMFGSFIRIGREGQVVDNVHAGGVYAQINVETGKIESEGMNTEDERFVTHPDSGIKIVGLKIPKWEEMKKCCINAHKSIDLPFVGWDIVLTRDGNLDIIEANHAPDMDVMQQPLRKGRRNDFMRAIEGYSKFKGIKIKKWQRYL